MNHTISDIYKDYKEDKGDIPKSLFVDICAEFNMGMIDYLLEGKEFNMGYNLSTLSIVRKDRDPRNPRVDWGESKAKTCTITKLVKVLNGTYTTQTVSI